MTHFDPLLTSLTAAVSYGMMQALTLIAQGTSAGAAADLSSYFSVIEKLGVVGGAVVCCFFLYKAVVKKDEQLQAAHEKHLADLNDAYIKHLAATNDAHEKRIADFKAQIEYLKSLDKAS